jgi:hypothetical protein
VIVTGEYSPIFNGANLYLVNEEFTVVFADVIE